jgi:transposase
MLAEQDRRGLAPTIHVPTAAQLEQRTLSRHRYMLVLNHTRAVNIIHSILAMHGVKAKINDLMTKPDKKGEMVTSVPYYVSLIVNHLLGQCTLLDLQIEQNETELDRLLPEHHPNIKLLLTVPGIGIVLARIIHTEIMDIIYFKEPKYLISYSGLAPVESDSAGRKGIIKLNRHCNYYLKYAFIEAAHHASTHVKYRRKYDLDVKKHGKIIAKLNLARRLVKSVYWILTRQQPYKM